MKNQISIARSVLSVWCVLTLLVAGCATDPAQRGPEVWYQAGKTSAQAYADWAACQMQAQQTQPTQFVVRPGLMNTLSADDWKDLARDAMRGRGYTIVRAGSITNGRNYPRP